MRAALILLFDLILLVVPFLASARTWHVSPDGLGEVPTIQSAIDSAAAGDSIVLADGTYTGTGNRGIDLHRKAITIRSTEGDPSQCIIDCEMSDRGFLYEFVTGPDAVLEGLTISNALSPVWGAALHCYASTPLIINCIFLSNVAQAVAEGNERETIPYDVGAGIACIESSPTLVGCQFLDNTATWGGGMYCDIGSSPSLSGCMFAHNSASAGGGLLCIGNSSPSLSDCQFVENTSMNIAGGAYFNNSEAIISHCLFRENSAAEWGAGLVTLSGALTIGHCTFDRNMAGDVGGGMHCESDSLTIVTNCTFYGNSSSDGFAGGIHLFDASIEIMNTIIAFSTSGEAVGCLDDSRALLHCCDLYGNAGGDWVGCVSGQLGSNGNMSADPVFCAADLGDLSLWDWSPCLDQPGCGEVIGAHGAGCTTSDTPREIGSVPSPIEVSVRPNPFKPFARILFVTRVPGPVDVSVYDMRGRLVRQLSHGWRASGVHSEAWDGCNSQGGRLAAGIYCVRVELGSEAVVRKVTMMR